MVQFEHEGGPVQDFDEGVDLFEKSLHQKVTLLSGWVSKRRLASFTEEGEEETVFLRLWFFMQCKFEITNLRFVPSATILYR